MRVLLCLIVAAGFQLSIIKAQPRSPLPALSVERESLDPRVVAEENEYCREGADLLERGD